MDNKDKRIEELTKALEYYADESIYDYTYARSESYCEKCKSDYQDRYEPDVLMDGGRVAKETLERTKRTELLNEGKVKSNIKNYEDGIPERPSIEPPPHQNNQLEEVFIRYYIKELTCVKCGSKKRYKLDADAVDKNGLENEIYEAVHIFSVYKDKEWLCSKCSDDIYIGD